MTRGKFNKCLDLFSTNTDHGFYSHDCERECCLGDDDVQDFIWNIINSDKFANRYLVEEPRRREKWTLEMQQLKEEQNNRLKVTNLTEAEMTERDEPFEFMRLEMKKDLTVVEEERLAELSKIYTNATGKGAGFRAVRK